MKKCEKVVMGPLMFGPKIDITDPCYDRDVWCRMNDVEIVPGDYTAIAYLKDTGGWGKRVATLGIYLNGIVPKVQDMHMFREGIGVDAGMAGFFEGKPDFTDDQWGNFCDMCRDAGYPSVFCEDHGLFHGFCSSSGYGDGGYPVFVARNAKGEICALEIRFLSNHRT